MFSRRKKRQRVVEVDDAVLTAARDGVAQMEFEITKRYATILFGIIFIALLLLIMRAVYLTVIRGEAYAIRAEDNSTAYTIIPAPRGIITDRFGEPLVENVPQSDIIALLSYIPRDEAVVREQLARIARITGESVDVLLQKITAARKNRQAVAVLLQNITQEQRFAFAAMDLPGFRLMHTPRRHYIDSAIFAHIIGYTGIVQAEDVERNPRFLPTDHVGRTGVEKVYDDILRGVHGATGVEVDVHGRMRRVTQDRAPQPGSDIALTIDAALQKAATTALERALARHNLTRGSVVVLDPRDGSIRALVSLPSYDNNLFIGGIDRATYAALVTDPDRPLFHRAIAGAYPPGSTVKPMLAAAALDAGVVDETTTVNSTGAIRVGAYTFRDWRANGVADVRRAIATSHNIFFYAIGGGYGPVRRGMGMDVMKRYYTRFGFGEKTGIDLPSESPGFIPTPAWKVRRFGEPWTIGNDFHAAIGQGYVKATPLQVALATAVVANGGTLWTPHVFGYQRDARGQIISYKPRARREHVLPDAVLRVAREGMRMAVTEGTARLLRTLPFPVAAKTGTAQFGTQGLTHSWLTSFAPYDAPEIVVLAMVEAQKSGPNAAPPVVKEIYEWYATHRWSRAANTIVDDATTL